MRVETFSGVCTVRDVVQLRLGGGGMGFTG